METVKIEIALPAQIEVKRNGGAVMVETAKLPTDVIGKLVEMALGNKVGDAAASVPGAVAERMLGERYTGLTSLKARRERLGALITEKPEVADTIAKESVKAMEGPLAALYAGDWTQRRAVADKETGLTPVQAAIARIIMLAKPEAFKDVRGEVAKAKAALAVDERQTDAAKAALSAKAEEMVKASEGLAENIVL